MPKTLVRFKRKIKQEGEVTEKASPPPVFDYNKVKTPLPTRKLPKFKERREYIAILQYRPGIKKHSDYQKLGFKVDGGYLEAAIEADKMAKMLGRAIAVDLYEIRKRELCRVLAVYEVTAFKDWEKENNIPGANKQVQEVLKSMKKEQTKENTPITFVKTRG